VSPPTDVEISRALNALSMTFGEQRLESFDAARAQAIVSGALAGEHKLEARATGPTSGELRIRDDGRLVATVELRDGRWSVERRLRAGESPWLPQPAAGNRSRPD
jgi:nitrogen fixation protein FixH